MRRRERRLLARIAFTLAMALGACGESSPGVSSRTCTELACGANGIDVDFVFRDRGSYTFTVRVASGAAATSKKLQLIVTGKMSANAPMSVT